MALLRDSATGGHEINPGGELVIAIDPGGTTGIAVKTSDGRYLTCTASTPEEVADFLFTKRFTHLIVENFQAQTIGKWGLHTVRIVGGCYMLAYLKGATYVHHVPQDRYPFQQEAKEMLQGTKAVIHEQDALAHLLRWEYDQKKCQK